MSLIPYELSSFRKHAKRIKPFLQMIFYLPDSGKILNSNIDVYKRKRKS